LLNQTQTTLSRRNDNEKKEKHSLPVFRLENQ